MNFISQCVLTACHLQKPAGLSILYFVRQKESLFKPGKLSTRYFDK